MEQQTYEEYWKLTLEYSDIHGENFIGTLNLIVDFIDQNNSTEYSEDKYKALQETINAKFPKEDMASVRKSINQFLKLGFVNFQLKSYHPNTKEFLSARTNRKRKTIFSRIVYTNSSFNRAVTTDSNERQINFLIKTLAEVGKLHKEDIISLMTVDISAIGKGYLDASELREARRKAEAINFIKRKYNQVSYLWGILDKLDDLVIVEDSVYFEEDAQVIFEDVLWRGNERDQYLHRIYKNQLKEESIAQLGDVKCMVEKLTYPTLVASHIKPFVKSSEQEAYDPNNGLLLSQNIDGLFDKGYISFSDEGVIILSDKLDLELASSLSKYVLDKSFLKDERKVYLGFHRSWFKDKLGIK